jgi:ubiquinone/menaquinone biosynthesis C-methylase UbiE
MNRIHHWYCARPGWAKYVRDELVPGSVAGVDLGDDVLEVGPGPGTTTEALATVVGRLTALEIDAAFAEPLARRLADTHVQVRQGDATEMPFPDGRFSAVVCFTMLHHVPTPSLQNRIFAEAHRVLRPGGVFLGSDSRGLGLRFRLLHIRDTKVLVDPVTLPGRLADAGFDDVDVDPGPPLRFRAVLAA